MATTRNEKGIKASSTSDVAEGIDITWTATHEKALIRKIDLRIFPVLILLFILNFIDRGNFANARLKGLEKDLHLTDVSIKHVFPFYLWDMF